jgi:MSHA biogenesis protein MshJ
MKAAMKGPLKEKIHLWSERFEALSLRERALFLVSIIAILYIFWDMVLMERVQQQQKTAVIQMKKWQSQISDIDNRIQLASAAMSGDKQKQAMQRIERLKAEISDINKRQKALTVGFIRPQQMVDVLKGLLATERGLQLTRLQSQVVQPLIRRLPEPSSAASSVHKRRSANATQQPKKSLEENVLDDNASSTTTLPEVYKHGLEIVFQGDYNSTLSYLRKLEQLPWKFYWEEVVYEVLDYPKAQILVRIHTLSLDKGWISV